MRIKLIFQLVLIASVMIANMAKADMVILKSGELFQTSQAWKENGLVYFYKHSNIVHVKESEVERLIHTSLSDQAIKPSDPPPADHSKASLQKIAPVSSSTAALPNEEHAGHLDLKWGTPVSQVDGLESAGTDPAYGGVALYALANRERFGRAHVDRILLGFWQDRLYTITVWTGNFLDFRELKAEAFRRYGNGQQKRKNVETFHWMDDTTDRLLSYDFETDAGYLWMRSSTVHQMVKTNYPE